MPQIISFAALIVSSLATTVLGANLLYLGTLAAGYAGLSYGLALLQGLLVDQPSVPKPDDGSYNLKQSVPSIAIILGRRKKGGDYASLEEKDGTAYHDLIEAGHRIHGFVKHFLHDEEATLDGDGVVIAPAHFDGKVKIKTRAGLDAETAYPELVAAFPGIFTADHRGDGLAQVLVMCETVDSNDYLDVFPNQMPQHSNVIDGALVFDPRNPAHDPQDSDTFAFAQNLTLLRAHQLTNPWGGKQNLADLYLPEWAHGADVSDQSVINRDGDPEPRYHGGIWFRANNSQIDVGRLLDQAGEMVVYERPDGLIGVHAGEMVEPDIRLTEDNIIRFQYRANKSTSATVLAVRGRYTSAEHRYNTVDAAIRGNPYIGEDTERTRTLDNQVIERHNHCQRLQEITLIRANAPRVSLLADYEVAKNAAYRRFVRVHYPPYCDEAILEITASPKFSFRNLTVELSGIIVPATLYDPIEEGEPPAVPERVVGTGVPMPVNFTVTIAREAVSGSNKAAYALAAWDHVADALRYELEWQATAGANQLPFSIMSKSGDDEVRSTYLPDGVPHRFRLRTWSNGARSEWTDYILLTPVADDVAPVALKAFTQTAAAPHLGNAVFSFQIENDSQAKTVQLFRKLTGVALTTAADVIAQCTAVGAPLVVTAMGTYGQTDGDITRTNLALNSSLTTNTGLTLGAGWSTGVGGASKALAANSTVAQAASIAAGAKARIKFEVSAYTSGAVRARISQGASPVNDAGDHSAVGIYLETITATTIRNTVSLRGDSAFVGTVKDLIIYEETATCAPQGVMDYYALAFNGSGVAGPPSGPITLTII